MEWITELWSPAIILLAAFVIGWGAETAQTFIPRAVALSILAWLQTLPEFAVEAAYAWSQDRNMMIANLTGSLRLIVGFGWPMIFFTNFFSVRMAEKRSIKEIRLHPHDSLGVVFLFISTIYFVLVLCKGTLSCWDSIILTLIYVGYLIAGAKFSGTEDAEDEEDLPWVGRKIVHLSPVPKYTATILLFAVGGLALWYTVHPFIDTLQRWSVSLGISTFVFVQWVAPFLSEFPEKVSAFNWARQVKKAPMAMMNMVNSNINQWTMLAAMIPAVFNISLGHFEPVVFDHMHKMELALTIAQSVLGGMLLLDMSFSMKDAIAMFVLFTVQFVVPHLREEVMFVYCAWIVFELGSLLYRYFKHNHVPNALAELRQVVGLQGR